MNDFQVSAQELCQVIGEQTVEIRLRKQHEAELEHAVLQKTRDLDTALAELEAARDESSHQSEEIVRLYDQHNGVVVPDPVPIPAQLEVDFASIP